MVEKNQILDLELVGKNYFILNKEISENNLEPPFFLVISDGWGEGNNRSGINLITWIGKIFE